MSRRRPAPARSPLPRFAGAAAAALLALTASLTVGAPPAAAGTEGSDAAVPVVTHGQRALAIAAAQEGAPYRYGASGPDEFDCSGLTQFAYASVGIRLPRTAAAQYAVTRHISPSQRRPGDLVFFPTPEGAIFHVGIYAGDDRVWHAPRPGTTVRLERIWTDRVLYGRVR